MFWPVPEGDLEDADLDMSVDFDGAASEGCEGSCLDSFSFDSSFGAGLDSSGGISNELMSSPGSARTAILVPTCTPFVPSAWMIFAMMPSS